VDLGFDTIGNATLICYDRGPALVTDPWIAGSAYFGSWTLSHEIPPEQREAIARCPIVWISHGHPDHLSIESLEVLGAREKRILLPDHVGGRIFHDLTALGFDAHVLPDRTWHRVSERVRIMCLADYNQDAALLVDLDGTLVVNANDAGVLGGRRFVRTIARRYPVSFLLSLSGFGDANMINLFTEDGVPIPPAAARRFPVGRKIAFLTDAFGATHFVPFSSMHRYQRADSVWANRYTTALEDYPVGFDSPAARLLPAFIRYECAGRRLTELSPAALAPAVRAPQEFGDDWSEPLEPADVRLVDEYFRGIAHLERVLDFVAVRVGGREHVVALGRPRARRGVTFEAPRHSLMTALALEIFDDLLIGNFMKTTLHGRWPRSGLHPEFTPYVAKYADGGRARSAEDLARYFAAYRRRAPYDYLRHRLEARSSQTLRRVFDRESAPYQLLTRTYRACVRATAPRSRDR
jgi:hypothetical protein